LESAKINSLKRGQISNSEKEIEFLKLERIWAGNVFHRGGT
jgi:hypothetical protein